MRYRTTENPYIWSRFNTGDTATITIYKASDDSVVVNAVSMNELASTGFFKYLFNPAPTSLTEYFYITTNGTEEHAGKIILGGYPDVLGDEFDGKWEIVNNQMIFYKSDNTTEIKRFNLFDLDGNPAVDNVYKRERV